MRLILLMSRLEESGLSTRLSPGVFLILFGFLFVYLLLNSKLVTLLVNQLGDALACLSIKGLIVFLDPLLALRKVGNHDFRARGCFWLLLLLIILWLSLTFLVISLLGVPLLDRHGHLIVILPPLLWLDFTHLGWLRSLHVSTCRYEIDLSHWVLIDFYCLNRAFAKKLLDRFFIDLFFLCRRMLSVNNFEVLLP